MVERLVDVGLGQAEQEDLRVGLLERRLEQVLGRDVGDRLQVRVRRLVAETTPASAPARRAAAQSGSPRQSSGSVVSSRRPGISCESASASAPCRIASRRLVQRDDVDDHRDAVALRDRLAEPALARHGRRWYSAASASSGAARAAGERDRAEKDMRGGVLQPPPHVFSLSAKRSRDCAGFVPISSQRGAAAA